jgi:hypothetical protein
MQLLLVAWTPAKPDGADAEFSTMALEIPPLQLE